MNDFLIYAIKSILSLSLFALVYRFVFPMEINFISRRLYLLVSVFLSFILPGLSYDFSNIFPLGQNPVNRFLIDEITIYATGLKSIGEKP